MNKPTPTPLTGLKGALAGLMSGGWMGLLLHLLFRRRIAPMLAALENLFARWQAGTLPPPPAPALARTTARPAPTLPRARQRSGRRVPAARRRPVAPAPRVRPAAARIPATPPAPAPAARAPAPSRRHARCTTTAGKTRFRTP